MAGIVLAEPAEDPTAWYNEVFDGIAFPACDDCTIAADDVARTVSRKNVLPRGSVDAPIVIVGEAPGDVEEKLHKAFVGPAGRKLDERLRAYNISLDDCYITNGCKCRPVNNREPSSVECRICRSKYLVNEINAYPRKLIIALGNYGYYSVVPKGTPSGITKRNGIFEDNEEFGCPVLPCIHPAAILHRPSDKILMNETFKKAAAFIKNDFKFKDKVAVDYKPIYDLASFWDFISEVQTRGRFVVDLETTGFVWTDKILCMTFSTQEQTAWYLPLHEHGHWMWSRYDWDVIQEGLRSIFEDPEIGVIAFNAKFDFKFLTYQFGWNICGCLDDPMLMHHLIEEWTPHGLKDLASRYTDMGNYARPLEDEFAKIKNSRIPKEDKHYGAIPSDMLREYAYMDADATYRVYNKFKATLPKIGERSVLYKFYRRCIIPTMLALMEMELIGICIDHNRMSDLEIEFEARLATIQEQFSAETETDVLITSSEQLSNLLFGTLGYRVIKRGKKYPSTAEEVLKELAKETGDLVFTLVLEHRKLSKLRNTYLKGMKAQIAADGRIHTSYLLHGTVTGRLSSRKPNLQNIPRESRIKNLFIPTPGYLFISSDYSQHEVRMWANYSRDEGLIEALSSGDVHSNIGAMLLNKPADEISKEERVFVKGVVFGLMYGRGAPSLAVGIAKTLEREVTREEAQKFIDLFFSLFPTASRWLLAQEKRAVATGKIITSFGRIRHLPEARSGDRKLIAEARRNARNSPIQGLASDVTNIALVRITRAFRARNINARLLLQVHDELLVEAHIDELERAVATIEEQMLAPIYGINIPLAIDLKVVSQWGGAPIKDWRTN